MGFNRRKMEEQRREAAEKEAATRRATDAQVLEDAERLIAAWNERQALRAPMIFSRHSSLSTNGRFNASMRNQPDDDELMNAMFLQLQIKGRSRWSTNAPGLQFHLAPARIRRGTRHPMCRITVRAVRHL